MSHTPLPRHQPTWSSVLRVPNRHALIGGEGGAASSRMTTPRDTFGVRNGLIGSDCDYSLCELLALEGLVAHPPVGSTGSALRVWPHDEGVRGLDSTFAAQDPGRVVYVGVPSPILDFQYPSRQSLHVTENVRREVQPASREPPTDIESCAACVGVNLPRRSSRRSSAVVPAQTPRSSRSQKRRREAVASHRTSRTHGLGPLEARGCPIEVQVRLASTQGLDVPRGTTHEILKPQ